MKLQQEFPDVIATTQPNKLPLVRVINHLTDLVPRSSLPNLAHYWLSRNDSEFLQAQVEKLLDDGLIRPTINPCVFLALLVPKKKREWHMCIDSCTINWNYS